MGKPAGAPLEVPGNISVKRRALVLGAGVAGGRIAERLAELGVEVAVVEKEKSATERGLDALSGTELLAGSRLAALEGNFGDYRAFIQGDDSVVEREVGAVVVSVGLERKQQSELPLAVGLKDFLRRASEGKQFRRLCFLMDLEQSTPLADFRLGLEAASEAARAGADAYFVCREVKVAEEGLERLYRSAREEGVLFIKYVSRPSVATLGKEVSVQVADYSPGAASQFSRLCLSADVLVVADTVLPREDNPALAGLLRIDVDEEGYFQPENVRLNLGRTNRRGIFVAGDCRGPATPLETLAQAEATAQEVASLLGDGEVKVDWPVAVVDPEKCAYCLTCNRICPHKAAGMNPEQEAAIIFPADCYGCGTCVGECPSLAITMKDYADADFVEALRR